MRVLAGLFGFLALLAGAAPLALAQQPPPPDDKDKQQAPPPEERDLSSIVVTGTKVRQGGAQDIGHFRSVAQDEGMPRPESLTLEGLLGEHDLDLKSSALCRQLFCLAAEAMPAALPTRPDDRYFVGLGFTSNTDAATWKRDPLNLVAVVDKSGSMDGPPLELVRQSLRQVVRQMGPGDQISIILYGDTAAVYLPPTPIATARDKALRAIDAIRSAGSTDMESGLKVGYETAFAAQPAFRGNTRLMLFTDEQPNVGRTDAASFIGMAEAASRRGTGLTTIGVGVQYDGALGAKVSSARGGNLFFLAKPEDVKSVFESQLDTMVSELAHDVRIAMTPRAGYRISGVFGVPDALMTEGKDGTVVVTVPTAFLSKNGGGIFLSLGKASDRQNLPAVALDGAAPFVQVALDYVGAKDGRHGADTLNVAAPTPNPSAPLRLAHRLVDEYFVLRDATTAFHRDGKPKAAFALLSGLSQRLGAEPGKGLERERKLVGELLTKAAFYSGYGGEQPKSLRHLAVVGTWEVSRIDGLQDVRRGDLFSFTSDREFVTVARGKKQGEEESASYEINERQLFLPSWHMVFDYRMSGDLLTLTEAKSGATLFLRRTADRPES
jgi:Ca-activated chloride channel family protein